MNSDFRIDSLNKLNIGPTRRFLVDGVFSVGKSTLINKMKSDESMNDLTLISSNRCFTNTLKSTTLESSLISPMNLISRIDNLFINNCIIDRSFINDVVMMVFINSSFIINRRKHVTRMDNPNIDFIELDNYIKSKDLINSICNMIISSKTILDSLNNSVIILVSKPIHNDYEKFSTDFIIRCKNSFNQPSIITGINTDPSYPIRFLKWYNDFYIELCKNLNLNLLIIE